MNAQAHEHVKTAVGRCEGTTWAQVPPGIFQAMARLANEFAKKSDEEAAQKIREIVSEIESARGSGSGDATILDETKQHLQNALNALNALDQKEDETMEIRMPGMPREMLMQFMGIEATPRQRVEVVAEGTQIIIPKGMTKARAIEELKRQQQQDEQEVAVSEKIDAFPLDGAHALMLALRDRYGWANLQPTPGFFGSSPPTLIGVEVSPGETVQVPWGQMSIPNVDGSLRTGLALVEDRVIFELSGKVKRRCAEEVSEIATLVRKYVKERSIYKGKAVRYSFESLNEPSDFNINDVPAFIDTTQVKEEELVLPSAVLAAVRANLITPITQTAECERHGIPLKRGLLLAGKYGTGKTLTAYVAAKKCAENGWTFIYLEDVENLPRALEFAKQYEPAMVFAEDIDRVTEGKDDAERDDTLNDIANTLDGITSKSCRVFVVLTTNHPDRINRVMLRPGRIDCYIEVAPPDAEAAERLARLYARGLIDESEDLSEASQRLAGLIPAVIREVVERSKLHAIARKSPGAALMLTAQDLNEAVESMRPHLELLDEEKKKDEGTIEVLARYKAGNKQNGVTAAAILQ